MKEQLRILISTKNVIGARTPSVCPGTKFLQWSSGDFDLFDILMFRPCWGFGLSVSSGTCNGNSCTSVQQPTICYKISDEFSEAVWFLHLIFCCCPKLWWTVNPPSSCEAGIGLQCGFLENTSVTSFSIRHQCHTLTHLLSESAQQIQNMHQKTNLGISNVLLSYTYVNVTKRIV